MKVKRTQRVEEVITMPVWPEQTLPVRCHMHEAWHS